MSGIRLVLTAVPLFLITFDVRAATRLTGSASTLK
jgi:hypothetical protein